MSFWDNVWSPRPKKSFSQCGEDMIVDFIFKALHIKEISYLDIGAHHPHHLSNTYHFYLDGHKGVCIEPDPTACKLIKRKRPKDVCLNIGIGVSSVQEANFYVMSSPTLNTFSLEDAERYQNFGHQKIEKVLKIPLLPINDILAEYFNGAPHFVSLDVEGLDLPILQSIDFSRHRPTVFCVETLTYTEDNSEEKLTGIIDFLLAHQYMLYADTFINSIFVDQGLWRQRNP